MFRFTIKTQKCNELTKIDKGIGNGIFWRIFKSNLKEGQTVYFGLSFCRFVEKFNFYEN
jgi:hypothetical protein